MELTKKNFSIAKAVKHLASEGSPLAALHITNAFTEVTDGHFAIRMAHSPQQGLEFAAADPPVDILLGIEDALNIASSLSGEAYVKAILPAPDKQTVQVEFDSGEIRILPQLKTEEFPRVSKAMPSGDPRFSILLNAEFMATILSALKAAEVEHACVEFWGNQKIVKIRPAFSAESDNPAVFGLLMPVMSDAVVDLPGNARTRTKAAGAGKGEENVLNLQ